MASFWAPNNHWQCVYSFVLQKQEIGHFQSTSPLWVSRLQVITVNCWICWWGEHYNHVFPDKAVLKQTKSYPASLSSLLPKVLDWIDLYANASVLICPIFIKKKKKKTGQERCCSSHSVCRWEIALGWYPSLWPYIVLQPRHSRKSNKEPLQANVITLHPRCTRLSIRTMALTQTQLSVPQSDIKS